MFLIKKKSLFNLTELQDQYVYVPSFSLRPNKRKRTSFVLQRKVQTNDQTPKELIWCYYIYIVLIMELKSKLSVAS